MRILANVADRIQDKFQFLALNIAAGAPLAMELAGMDNVTQITTDRRPAGMDETEWALRQKLAACYRIFDHLGWPMVILIILPVGYQVMNIISSLILLGFAMTR